MSLVMGAPEVLLPEVIRSQTYIKSARALPH
jgi:hypothetical protein